MLKVKKISEYFRHKTKVGEKQKSRLDNLGGGGVIS